ncbi:MAG: hypothetical protein BWY19_00786 [bacterium ADurb.Bin212]|nr:MAG: hypothetical protein BWY19_00786 [bacterium ADurb.Bin212]
MKSDEIILILKTFQKTIDPKTNEHIVIEEVIKRVGEMALGLKFYSNGHYDNGYVARKALEELTPKDVRHSGFMKQNVRSTRKSYMDTES